MLRCSVVSLPKYFGPIVDGLRRLFDASIARSKASDYGSGRNLDFVHLLSIL